MYTQKYFPTYQFFRCVRCLRVSTSAHTILCFSEKVNLMKRKLKKKNGYPEGSFILFWSLSNWQLTGMKKDVVLHSHAQQKNNEIIRLIADTVRLPHYGSESLQWFYKSYFGRSWHRVCSYGFNMSTTPRSRRRSRTEWKSSIKIWSQE